MAQLVPVAVYAWLFTQLAARRYKQPFRIVLRVRALRVHPRKGNCVKTKDYLLTKAMS